MQFWPWIITFYQSLRTTDPYLIPFVHKHKKSVDANLNKINMLFVLDYFYYDKIKNIIHKNKVVYLKTTQFANYFPLNYRSRYIILRHMYISYNLVRDKCLDSFKWCTKQVAKSLEMLPRDRYLTVVLVYKSWRTIRLPTKVYRNNLWWNFIVEAPPLKALCSSVAAEY